MAESKSDEPIAVGTHVIVHGKHRGTVRHVGPVQFTEEAGWLGVELERPNGKHNGTVDGTSYFECPMNHGVFVHERHVESFTEEAAAVNAIQSASRGFLAKKKAKAARNVQVWNTLDNHNEQLALKRGAKMRAAQTLVPQRGDSPQPAAAGAPQAGQPEEEDGEEISEAYDGAHLSWPLTLDTVVQMLEAFKAGKPLHIKFACQVLLRARKLLAGAPTLQNISVPEGKKLTIVGDLHGQLQDLFSIFTINGLPSADNMYLFNGDFVDRGDFGAEVFLTLACFKLLYPETVFLDRGNHESRSQNSWMGFEEEVLAKYDGASNPSISPDRQGGRRLYNLFQNCFDMLPLCAMVEGKIFVVHGGLFARDGVTLSHIEAIKRKREPPLHGSTFEEQLMEELLWSDPRPITGRQASERGAGIEFGQDVTNNFCSTNRVALIVRSHECVQEGFEIVHGGRLITLFSASRYCGTQTNKGAFLTLGHDLQPEIQQFYAHSMQQTDFGVAPSQAELEQKLEDDAVRLIVERIVDHKPSLYWWYAQQDAEHTGRVSRVDWANGLKSVLQLDLPFMSYQSRLAELEDDGSINYGKFLERYRISMCANAEWEEAVTNAICQKLFKAFGAGNLEQAFSVFDLDSDGFIEYAELVSTLNSMDVGLTDDQIYELMRSADADQDGRIDFAEFAQRFQVSFNRVAGSGGAGAGGEGGGEAQDEWTQQTLNTIGAKLFGQGEEPEVVFGRFDKNSNGQLTVQDFSEALQAIDISLTPEEVQKVFTVVDTDASGGVDIREFVSAFSVKDQSSGAEGGPAPWQDMVLQQVANVLYQHRIHIRSAFRMFDVDNSGSITAEEFRSGLGTINSLLDRPLTNDQIDGLLHALDVDHDGQLSYQEFFSGFKLVDTRLAAEEEAGSSA